MSNLTQCNYCTLEGIRAYAAQTRQEILLETDEHGWIEVYTRALPGRSSEQSVPDKVWCATMLALTDHCVC